MLRALLLCFLLGVAFSADRSGTTYINSNDRVRLQLSSHPMLRGPPGTIINLKLFLINEGGASNFIFNQDSEDGFLGEIVDPSSSFLTTNMRQEISILRMRVPNRPEGTVLRTTFHAIRQKSWRKRRATQVDRFYPDNTDTYSNGNVDLASLSIQYLVTSDTEREFYPPSVKLRYEAQSGDETCSSESKNPGRCNRERWALFVDMVDEEAGLSHVDIHTTSTDFGNEREGPLHYRMINFPVGSTETQVAEIDVSCCMKSISIQVHNTAGEVTLMEGHYDAYGDQDSDDIWSDGLFIALIVAAIFIVCLVIGLIVICIHVRRTRYSSVSQR